MGNSASSAGRAPHEDSVDHGSLLPQGVYTGPRDWNQQIVTQLIIERKLAPFYRPLEEYDESWDDEQILAARKELPDTDVATSESSTRPEGVTASRSTSYVHAPRRPAGVKEHNRIPEAAVYRGAVECPICFLYYPPNINHSRCCDQAICTECFVQIKRNEPTTTHVVSEPAACPYCVQDNFGVTYSPPAWRAGIGSESWHSPIHPTTSRSSSQQSTEAGSNKEKAPRKSFGHDSREVVTIDQIRPDWEQKLAAVRAAVARRANRRIIMRQVGDRLIPVGVTSGRIQPVNGDASHEHTEGSEEPRSSRRSRRRQHQQPQDLNQLLGSMGLGGQDLEELMVMEAMRLSLMEHEEQQRREAEKKRKEAQEGTSNSNANAEGGATPSTSSAPRLLLPIPSPGLTDAIPIRSSPSSESSASTEISSHPSGTSPSNSASNVNTLSSNRLHAPNVPSPLKAASALTALVIGSPASAVSMSGAATPPSRRTPSPRPRRSGESPSAGPFSTVGAAIAASSTATAVLGGVGTSANAPTPISKDTIEGQHGNQSGPATPPKPTNGSTSSSPAPKMRSQDSMSSVAGPAVRYDELPSSPESTISRRPLLTDTPTSEFPGETAADDDAL